MKNRSNIVTSEHQNNRHDQAITIWRGGEGNQDEQNSDLSDWTGKVNEALVNMEAVRQPLGGLQVKFEIHLSDLSMQCKEKDDQIERQLATIRNKLEEERKEMDRQKLEKEKSTEAMIAREKKSLQDEFEKTMILHRQSHEDHRKQLKDDFERQKEESNRKLTALEAENRQLSGTIQEQSQKLQTQETELKRNAQRSDILQQSIYSYKMELEDKEKELSMMKSTFTLRSRSLDDLKKQFAKISVFIEDISVRYFTGLMEKDPGSAHEELVAADPFFANVPIDESEDSYNLRIVHVQRVISEALCKYIWKPFRSECTFPHEELASFLLQMMNALDKSSLAGRPANVWTALSMRALKLLPEGSLQKSVSNPSTTTNRAKNVISTVYNVLSPLLNPSRSGSFAADLSALTDLAIDVWETAQTDPAKYQEWRYQAFDPTTTLDGYNTISNEIFLLFPRVEAMVLSGQTDQNSSPRPSPGESISTANVIELCLHPGRGLPHSSEIVLRGIQAQEEIEHYIEIAKREARLRRYTAPNGKRTSTASST
ncbi:hypothetical protein F5884DRAFT_758355 [Xylogone sp. PMI_703]|nr:hypothetical protein F5884DRAFT_758355 [Xylogone sp. PMI_703]